MKKNVLLYVNKHILILAIISVYLSVMLSGKAQKIGDGGEYYAMFWAWAQNNTPFATQSSIDVMMLEQKEHPIKHQASATALTNIKELTKQSENGYNQYDYPHFWMYSFLAAILYKLFGFTGITSTTAFLLLHLLLISGVLYLAYDKWKTRGIAAVLFLFFFSPIWWFSNKVHTEFFTFCLNISAIMLVMQKRYWPASFLLALSSTQNPLFGALSLLTLGMGILPKKKNLIYYKELLPVVSIGIILALHPAYYFFRYGDITPQFITGAAGKIEIANLVKNALVPLFDFSIGLFSNWLSLFLLFLISICFLKSLIKALASNLELLFFGLFFIAISFYSHGSTSNQNHGGIISCSRYATWYLPLCFPLLIWLIPTIKKNHHKLTSSLKYSLYTLIGVLAFLSLYYFNQNLPTRHPSNYNKGLVTDILIRHFSRVYPSFPQVFINNYIFENQEKTTAKGYYLPEAKMLLIDNQSSKNIIACPSQYPYIVFNPDLFFVEAQKWKKIPFNDKYTYYHIESRKELISSISNEKPLSKFSFAPGSAEADIYLRHGWHGGERQHRWSKEKAYIFLPSLISGDYKVIMKVLSPQDTPFKISYCNKLIFETDLKARKVEKIAFEFTYNEESKNASKLELKIANAFRPSDISKSQDSRMLGISLSKFLLIKNN